MSTSTTTGEARTRDLVNRHSLIVFFACTYALSWAVWAPLVVLGDEVPAAPALLLAMLGSWVPSTVGIALTARLRGRQGVHELLRRVVRLRVGARWYVAAFSLPLLMPLAVCINVLFGGDVPTLDTSLVGVVALFVVFIFPGSALGEEIGWRGVALPRLQADRGALHASLVLGLLWGIWHLPLFLLGSETRPWSIFPAFVCAAVAASVVYTWLYNGTGGSLAIVVVYHAAANVPLTVLLEPLGTRAAEPFLIYVALSVVAASAIVLIAGPKHLSRVRSRQVAFRSSAPPSAAVPSAVAMDHDAWGGRHE